MTPVSESGIDVDISLKSGMPNSIIFNRACFVRLWLST